MVFFLCFFGSFSTWAADHIVQRAYWEDATGQAGIEQAQKQQFTPYTNVLSQGFTQSAIWIRLDVLPPQGMLPDDKFVLRIRPVYLDEIRLYDPLDTSGRERVVGDRTDYRKAEYKSLSHTFVVPAGHQPRTLWLRLKATSTSLINVEALTQQEMVESEFRLLAGYFVVLSLIVVFLIVVFINWLNDREFLYLAFVARHALYLVFSASFFGFHRLLLGDALDAHYMDLIHNWLVVGATGFSILFECIFLLEYSPPRWAKIMLGVLLAWSLSIVGLMASGQIFWALKVNMMLNACGVLVLLAVSWGFINDAHPQQSKAASLLPKKWVLAYYSSLTALLLFSVMPHIGVVAGNEFSINGLVFYALCSGAFITLLMQMRVNQLRKLNLRQKQDLLLSTQQIELEKVRREEQSQLLTMLMHELKTPLSVIDLAQQATTDLDAKGYVARNVTIIKNILDRCLNADRIALGQLDVDFQAVQLRSLLEQLIDHHQTNRFKLQWDMPMLEISVNTDYQCLQIILNNLLDNAVRYGDETQPVLVSVQTGTIGEGHRVVTITVANKTGMASWPDPDKVFKKYYRSIGAKTISGTGLGLFLVASIARIIGATCSYAPDDTHVRFELCLPV